MRTKLSRKLRDNLKKPAGCWLFLWQIQKKRIFIAFSFPHSHVLEVKSSNFAAKNEVNRALVAKKIKNYCYERLRQNNGVH